MKKKKVPLKFFSAYQNIWKSARDYQISTARLFQGHWLYFVAAEIEHVMYSSDIKIRKDNTKLDQ